MAANNYKLYTERELLERVSYMGPVQHMGGGVNKTYTWSGAETEKTIWTPQSGNRFVVSVLQISATTNCTLTIFDEVNGDEHILFKHTFDVTTAKDRYCCIPYPIPRVASAGDNKLQITTSGAGGTVNIWGWETGVGTTTTSTSTSTSTTSISTTSVTTSSSSVSTTSVSTSSTSSSTISVSTSSTSSSTISVSTSSSSSSSISVSSSSSSSSSISQSTTDL